MIKNDPKWRKKTRIPYLVILCCEIVPRALQVSNLHEEACMKKRHEKKRREEKRREEKRHFAAIRVGEFHSSSLSRACLGKMIAFQVSKWLTKKKRGGVFSFLFLPHLMSPTF
jgi:hypothetical protein